MTTVLGFKSWATGAMVLAAVAACGSNSSDPPTTSPASPSSTSPRAVTTSSSPTSPSEVAAANAESVVRRYYATLDQVRQDPTVPLARLSRAENGIELNADRRLITKERQQHLRQVGSIRLVSVVVQSVSLDNSDSKGGDVPTAQVDVCWDVSAVDLVDRKGKSVVSSTRPDQGSTRYFVTNPKWITHPSDGWRVSNGQDLKLASCSGS